MLIPVLIEIFICVIEEDGLAMIITKQLTGLVQIGSDYETAAGSFTWKSIIFTSYSQFIN